MDPRLPQSIHRNLYWASTSARRTTEKIPLFLWYQDLLFGGHLMATCLPSMAHHANSSRIHSWLVSSPFIRSSRVPDGFIFVLFNDGLVDIGISEAIVLLATLKLHMRLRYLSLEARCLIVISRFTPGFKASIQRISVFWILGPTIRSSSSKISGCILIKLKKDVVSFILSLPSSLS